MTGSFARGINSVATLRIVLADTDSNSREHARSMLKEFDDIDIVAECDTVENTIETVCGLRPHVLLADVRLRGGSAFAVIENIPRGSRPVIMLTSENAQYALRAFDVHAVDYFLKPINRDRLRESISNVQLCFARFEQAASVVPCSLAIVQDSERAVRRLCFRTGGRLIFLNHDDIDWIQAAANYVRLHVGTCSYPIRESIGHLASRLDPSRFIRIHRSIIVNLYRISQVRACNSGEFIVTLNTGKELSCSRNYRGSIVNLVSNSSRLGE